MTPPDELTAGAVVSRRLGAQVELLALQVVEIRDGEPEGIHQARIASRRLRSLLATYRPVFDREVTEPVRGELRWFGAELSEARDALVVYRRQVRLLEQEPFGLVRGPVLERLQIAYGMQAAAADHAVRDMLDAERYLELRQTLDRLVADPPWTGLADEPAAEVLPRRVRKDWKRMRRRYRDALETERGSEHHDVALHEVRKAAKRLRYAAETLEPAYGEDARRLAEAARKLTSLLGERQDTVVSRARLVDLSRMAEAAGESAFTYGRLHARERATAADVDRQLGHLWKRISRPKLWASHHWA